MTGEMKWRGEWGGHKNLPPERKGSVARLGAGSARKRGGTEKKRRRKITISIELFLQFVMYFFLTKRNERKMERYGGEREREVNRGGQCVIGGGKGSERERLTFLA